MPFGIVGAVLNALVGLVIGAIGVLKFGGSVLSLIDGGPFLHCVAGIALSICVMISAESVLHPQKTIRRAESTLLLVLIGMTAVIVILFLKVNNAWSRDEYIAVMLGSTMGICLVWGQLKISVLLRTKLRTSGRPRQVP